ncbi:hypothetical protein L596_028436 [Steinernema carpocapsae]|uniref:Calponin-homology (CH) domain-containing protein n=1 Tax=Steinernema carpocapsae TaxID=34508 RepID=A0A4U5LYJ8_STECR|nr:hypothetical protein L596_028436 [Steinernema carpocapsae]
MNANKERALTDWINLFGLQVDLQPVERLNEFVRGQHLPTVLKFMQTKKIPMDPASVSSLTFFTTLLAHLKNLQKCSPHKFHAQLDARGATYGQRLDIAKFLAIVIYEIRMDPELQRFAVDVVVPELTRQSRKELAEIMDHLDDSCKWEDGEWDSILFQGSQQGPGEHSSSSVLFPERPHHSNASLPASKDAAVL